MSDKNSFIDDNYDDMDDVRVTVSLDDGDVECSILTIFEVAGQDYIVLVPVDENDEPIEEGDVMVFRYHEDADGNPELSNIESDEEFERVNDRFEELLDEQEVQSLLDEDDN